MSIHNDEVIKQIETAAQFTRDYFPIMKVLTILLLVVTFATLITNHGTAEAPKSDAETVAALDTEFQAAVGRNDADTIDRILADDFVLILGNGTVYTKSNLLKEARSGRIVYEQQVEIDNSQRVRVWNDTAVVTAKLWVKGTKDGKAFDRKLWFSDTYVRTKNGWQYVLGQASLPLPDGQ